ncbi:MAG: glycosyltransferase family 4 protein [Saprospiraceae bacterium]
MKILQLCKKFPYPLKDGESIAVTYMSKALNELGCDLSLLAMNTIKHYFNTQDLPENFDHYQFIETVKIDNRVKPKDAFFNLFKDESYHVSRFVSEEYKSKLIDILKKNTYDVIQLETLYLAPYIPIIRQYSNAIIAMRSHNVEHEIWERIAENTKLLPKRLYLKHLTEKLKNFEIEQLNAYDIMVAITQRDLDLFRKLGFKNKGLVAPIGFDLDNYHPNYKSYQEELSLSFIGSLDWMPNLEGLEWFLTKVMPMVRKRFPKIKLHIAGRNMPKHLLNYKGANVVIHGEVESSTAFLNQHSVMIVPLFSGSGMRAKILEAMSLGKISLTTSLGLEGIDGRDGEEVLIGNTAEAFLNQIEFCVKNKDDLEGIGKNARVFIEEQFDYKSVSKRLLSFYENMVYKKIDY